MERIRLSDCTLLAYLRRGLLKASRDLVEAAERTPHTVSSRRLVEDSGRLLLGLIGVVEELERRNGCRTPDTL